jgi:hypothetical protein
MLGKATVLTPFSSARFQNLRSTCTVYGSVHATAIAKACIGCIHNGINLWFGYISADDTNIFHHLLFLIPIPISLIPLFPYPLIPLSPYSPSLYTLFFESITIVTGPSFVSATFISAPNSPVCTGFAKASSNAFTNFSYNGMATSGFDAFI